MWRPASSGSSRRGDGLAPPGSHAAGSQPRACAGLVLLCQGSGASPSGSRCFSAGLDRTELYAETRASHEKWRRRPATWKALISHMIGHVLRSVCVTAEIDGARWPDLIERTRTPLAPSLPPSPQSRSARKSSPECSLLHTAAPDGSSALGDWRSLPWTLFPMTRHLAFGGAGSARSRAVLGRRACRLPCFSPFGGKQPGCRKVDRRCIQRPPTRSMSL